MQKFLLQSHAIAIPGRVLATTLFIENGLDLIQGFSHVST